SRNRFSWLLMAPKKSAQASRKSAQITHEVHPWGETVAKRHTCRSMIFTIQMAPFFGQSPQLVKRRRALLESNPPRNNQPETHQGYESGSSRGAAPHSIDRFPHA